MLKSRRHFSGNLEISKLTFKKAIEKPPTVAPLLKVVKIDHSAIEKEYPCISEYNTGQMVHLSPLLKRTLQSSHISLTNDISRHFSLFKNRVFLNRSSISALLSKPQRTILDGSTGIGKSTNLLLLTDILMNSKDRPNILYFPKVSSWIDGSFAYSFSGSDVSCGEGMLEKEDQMTTTYLQDDLARYLSRSILTFNPSMGKELTTIINSNPNSFNLSNFLNKLSKLNTIFIIDEIESLFSKINYRNSKSEQLTVDDFIILRTLKNIILNTESTFIGSTCRSNTKLDRSTLNSIPSAKISKVEPFSLTETEALLRYYSKMGHLFGEEASKISPKIRTVSGGIPKGFLRAVQYNNLYTRP